MTLVFRSISKRMLLLVLMTSTVITTVLTIISFYIDYDTEINLLEKSFAQLEKTSIKTMTETLYLYDLNRLEGQMQGLLNINDIIKISIYSKNNKKIREITKPGAKFENYLLVRQYPLVYNEAGNEVFLGNMSIVATKLNMYERLFWKVIYLFLSQGVKTLIVSFLILYIFNKMITRYLLMSRKFLKNVDINSEEPKKLYFGHRSMYRDELNDLEDELNKLVGNLFSDFKMIKSLNSELEQRVKDRTAELSDKNLNMKAMLENIGLGIFTIGSDLKIRENHSTYLMQLLENDNFVGKDVIDTLFSETNISIGGVENIRNALGLIFDENINTFSINKHLLPIEFRKKNMIIELDWSPIFNSHGLVETILIVMKDVSALRELHYRANNQKKKIEMIDQILNLSLNGFFKFYNEAYLIIEEINEQIVGENLKKEHILFKLHTLKGTSLVNGLNYFVESIHEFESCFKNESIISNLDFYPQT